MNIKHKKMTIILGKQKLSIKKIPEYKTIRHSKELIIDLKAKS